MKNSSFISKEMERTKEAAGKAIGKISHITDDTKSSMAFIDCIASLYVPSADIDNISGSRLS